MTAPPSVTGAIAFTDIAGFTAFCEAAGDEAAVTALEAQSRVVAGVLPADARLVKELGDGLMLWFPAAAEAVATCVELQRRLAGALSAGEFPLWVRVGLHHGPAVARGDDLVGHHVNVAARIVDLAGAREVLCSEAARDAAGEVPGVEFVAVGPAPAKGVAEPVWLYRAEAVTVSVDARGPGAGPPPR